MGRTDIRAKDNDRARGRPRVARLCSAPTSSGPLPRQVGRTITPRRCVPLSQIARLTPAVAPVVVNHPGQFPSVTLSFNLAPDATIGAAVSAVQKATRSKGSAMRVFPQRTRSITPASSASGPF
jgi:multidrug efflux pump subunit AcrB